MSVIISLAEINLPTEELAETVGKLPLGKQSMGSVIANLAWFWHCTRFSRVRIVRTLHLIERPSIEPMPHAVHAKRDADS